NRVTAANGGVFVAQSAPVLLIAGARSGRVSPARRCAWWHEVSRDGAKPQLSRRGSVRTIDLPWGAILVEDRAEGIVIAVGSTLAEAEAALLPSAGQITEEANAYAAKCDLLPAADPVLRSMVIHGVHAALSSIRS